MKRSLLNLSGAFTLSALALGVSQAYAEDELIVYTLRDGSPAEGLTVRLNGETDETVGQEGYAVFDLGGGAHSLAVYDGGTLLHRFRMNAADNQLTDVIINFVDGEPTVEVEHYYRTETAAERQAAPRGTLSGKVRSGGAPLSGATVTVQGTGISVTTDADGSYSVDLPRGIYDIEVDHPNYDGRELADLRVVSSVERSFFVNLGQTVDIGASLGIIEEVVVTGTYKPGGFEVDERDTLNVVDTLGIEQIARFGDTNVAASVVRVPSVTIQDGRFVFIRGLGDRYITSTLNNSTMPSTDPSKRTVPLDLFPANIVSQLDIKKTFVASMPGESTGGNLAINTRTFPDERDGKISISIAGTDGLTGEKIFIDPSDGDFDYLGWDDGTREEPIEVTAIAQALSVRSFTDPETGETFDMPDSVERELRRLGAILIKDDLDLTQTETALPKISIGANFGDLFYIGDAELGVFAAVNYKNGYSQEVDGINRTYTPSGDGLDNFAFTQYSNDIDISGLLSMGLNIGDTTYEANTIVSRNTSSKSRRSVGQESDEFQAQYRHTIDWIERQYLSQQVTGSHFLNADGSVVFDWQATASQARRYAPDRREVLFNADNVLTDPESLLSGFDFNKPNTEQSIPLEGFRLEVNELLRRYDDLVDNNYDVSGDLTWEIFSSGFSEANIKVGFQSIYRERDADSSSYGFNIPQGLVALSEAPNVLVSDAVTNDTITGSIDTGFSFFDKTLASDSYEAELELNSAYISYDHLFGEKYQVIAGVRYEDYVQTTETAEVLSGNPVESKIDEGTWMPSFGFNWFYTADQQLRLAVSRTVARPDFKETSNATFYDTQFDFRVRGNPNLTISEVLNYDLRWEWYFTDTESVSVAGFYKDVDDPIERVVQTASGTAGNSRTFRNAESAEIYGVEVEARKEFALNEAFTRSLFVATNAAWIESEVVLGDGSTRKLQGQPDYTFNLILGYDDIINGHELTLLFNQNGESIKDVGISGNLDVIEESVLDVKVVYKYELNDQLSFSASIDNLLDEEVEFSQGGLVFQSYKTGIEFDVSVDYSF